LFCFFFEFFWLVENFWKRVAFGRLPTALRAWLISLDISSGYLERCPLISFFLKPPSLSLLYRQHTIRNHFFFSFPVLKKKNDYQTLLEIENSKKNDV
jgi:hypothetical protein